MEDKDMTRMSDRFFPDLFAAWTFIRNPVSPLILKAQEDMLGIRSNPASGHHFRRVLNGGGILNRPQTHAR